MSGLRIWRERSLGRACGNKARVLLVWLAPQTERAWWIGGRRFTFVLLWDARPVREQGRTQDESLLAMREQIDFALDATEGEGQ